MANYKIRGRVGSILCKGSISYLCIRLDERDVEKVDSNSYYLKLMDTSSFNILVKKVARDENRDMCYVYVEQGSGFDTVGVLGQEVEIKFDQISDDNIIHNTSIKSISIGGYGSGGGNSSRRWSSEEIIDSLAPQGEEQHTEPTSSSRKLLQEEADPSKLQKEGQPEEKKMRIIRRK